MKRELTAYLKGAFQVIISTVSLIGLSCSAYAVEFNDVTKDILTVFQKDGGISMLLKSDVDSMRLSTIGVDGVEKTKFVTQEIFTKDSLYRYDLASVDSISFQPAPTVFAENVLEMDKLSAGRFRDYVIGSNFEFTHLFVEFGLPRDQMPEIGKVLFSDKIDEKLPNGFIGKVVRIDEKDGYYDIECENVSLDDVLISYCRVIETVIEEGGSPNYEQYYKEGASRTSPLIQEDLIYQNDNVRIPDIEYSFDEKSLGITIDQVEADILLNNPDYISERSNFLSGRIRLQTNSSIKAFYSKIANVPFQMKVVVDNEHSLTADIGVRGHLEFGPKNIFPAPDIPIPLNIPFVRTSVNLGVLTRFEGNFEVSLRPSIQFKTNLQLTFSPCLFLTPQVNFKLNGKPEITHNESLYGEAKLDIAPYIRLNLDFLDKAFLRFSAVAEGGIEASLKATLNFDELASARYSDALYKRLSQPDCFTVSPYFKVSGLVSISPYFKHLFNGSQTELEPISITVMGEPFVKRALIGKMTSFIEDYTFIDDIHSNLPVPPHFRASFEKGMEKIFSHVGLSCHCFTAVKDLTDPTQTDDLQNVELEHLLGEKENINVNIQSRLSSWGQDTQDIKGKNLYIGDYPLHSYEVTPYLVLSRSKLDEDGITKTTYFPMKTDIVRSWSLASQPEIKATYGYPFGVIYNIESMGLSTSQIRHMINFEIPNYEEGGEGDPEGSDEKKYLYIQNLDKNITTNKPLDLRHVSGGNYYDSSGFGLILPEEEEYDTSFDLALNHEHEIKKFENILEFSFPYAIGLCIRRNNYFVPISSQVINLKKEYVWNGYASSAKWTPLYDDYGNLRYYTLEYSFSCYFPFVWHLSIPFRGSISGEEIAFSNEILKYNPFLVDYSEHGYSFLRNSTRTIRGSADVYPSEEFTLSGYIGDYKENYLCHVDIIFRPNKSQPEVKMYRIPEWSE